MLRSFSSQNLTNINGIKNAVHYTFSQHPINFFRSRSILQTPTKRKLCLRIISTCLTMLPTALLSVLAAISTVSGELEDQAITNQAIAQIFTASTGQH